MEGGLYGLDNFYITIGALAIGIDQRLYIRRIYTCLACDRNYCVISKDLSEAEIRGYINQIRKKKEYYESKEQYEIRQTGPD